MTAYILVTTALALLWSVCHGERQRARADRWRAECRKLRGELETMQALQVGYNPRPYVAPCLDLPRRAPGATLPPVVPGPEPVLADADADMLLADCQAWDDRGGLCRPCWGVDTDDEPHPCNDLWCRCACRLGEPSTEDADEGGSAA